MVFENPLTRGAAKVLLTADRWVLVAAVLAVSVPVALPRLVDAATVGFALELQFTALQRAVLLVALVAAVVCAVAHRDAGPAVAVRALKHAGAADSCRAAHGLVRAVLAILLTVTPSNRNNRKWSCTPDAVRSLIQFARTSSTRVYISHREARSDAGHRCSWTCRSCHPSPARIDWGTCTCKT